MDIYGTNKKDYLQLVCARVIGRKIKILLDKSEDLMAGVKAYSTSVQPSGGMQCWMAWMIDKDNQQNNFEVNTIKNFNGEVACKLNVTFRLNY